MKGDKLELEKVRRVYKSLRSHVNAMFVSFTYLILVRSSTRTKLRKNKPDCLRSRSMRQQWRPPHRIHPLLGD